MKKIIYFILFFILSSSAFAGIPEQVDQEKFENIVQLAKEKGHKKNLGNYEYRILSRTTGKASDGNWQSSAFGLMGSIGNNGDFSAMVVTVMAEFWIKQEDGTWQMDEWTWTSGLDADLLAVEHARSILASDGALISKDVIPANSEDSKEEMDRWADQLIDWYEYQP